MKLCKSTLEKSGENSRQVAIRLKLQTVCDESKRAWSQAETQQTVTSSQVDQTNAKIHPLKSTFISKSTPREALVTESVFRVSFIQVCSIVVRKAAQIWKIHCRNENGE